MVQKAFLSNRDMRQYGIFELQHFDIFRLIEVDMLNGSKDRLLIVKKGSEHMKSFCLHAKSERESCV